MKWKELIAPSESDKGAVEMSYPNVYSNKDMGSRTKLRKEKVVIRNSRTGQVYGRRTLYTKSS